MKDSIKIITVPNQSLHQTTKKVDSFDDDLKKQINLMRGVLKQVDGIGLAAPQLGFGNSVFVVEFQDPEKKDSIPFQVFVNPKIIEKSPELEALDEGCLSIPNIFLPVWRSTKIKIQAQNEVGKKIKITANGLFAKVIAHENDHLSGILFTERIKEDLIKKYPKYKEKKIIFIGSGVFAEHVLRGLILLGFNIAKVITETPKPTGRKKQISPTPVAETAQNFQKKLIETENIKNLYSDIKALEPDLIILSDFGQIIPSEILNIPEIAAVNIHPSLLPKYRGATPIPSAILAGDKVTGVSLIKMSEKIDKGGILMQSELPIEDYEDSQALEQKLANLSLKILMDFIPTVTKENLKVKPQNEAGVTLTRKFKKEDGEIDWTKSAAEIERQIRAFYPWPGSYTLINDKRLIILQAHLEGNKLALDVVQPEGKNPMTWPDFLNGFQGEKPEWFNKISNFE